MSCLPEPSPSDVFLDLEGDPFAAEGGREYLFGVVTLDPDGSLVYRSFWAFTEHQERQAFESVIDLITQAWQVHQSMHVYHYAPYEPSAFKRLMGRYATREQELNKLLRAGRFVDLYAVVRQGIFAGVERYSIKNLEPIYGCGRAVPLVGMEFLYSLNRLNVATTRAKCAAILVASPRLFEPECPTPRHMKLANALCRYRELAQSVRLQ